MIRTAWLVPLAAVTALAGCGTTEKVDRYKIIAVKTPAEQRIVYRTKTVRGDCPPLPKIADGAGKPEVSIVNNNKSETFIEGTLNVLIGIIFAAAVGTKFGDSTPTMACFLGVIGGVAGSRIIEAISRLAPDTAWSLVAGWVEKLGGKPLDKLKERKNDAENDNRPTGS